MSDGQTIGHIPHFETRQRVEYWTEKKQKRERWLTNQNPKLPVEM